MRHYLGFEEFRPGIPYLGLTDTVEATTMPETCAHALGLPPTIRGRACIMQLGSGYPKINLTEWCDTSQAKPRGTVDLGCVRICLGSRNLWKDYERLSTGGVAFVSEPQLAKDGMANIAVCADPDGTLIELIQTNRDKWPVSPPPGI